MTDIDRWILSYQGRVANIWYNQDYTVYGVNPGAWLLAAGRQQHRHPGQPGERGHRAALQRQRRLRQPKLLRVGAR